MPDIEYAFLADAAEAAGGPASGSGNGRKAGRSAATEVERAATALR